MVFLEPVYQYLSLISANKLHSVQVMLRLPGTSQVPAPAVRELSLSAFACIFPAAASRDPRPLPTGIHPLRRRLREWEGDEEQSGHDRELHPPALHLAAGGHCVGPQTPPADRDLGHGAEPDQRLEGPRGPKQKVRKPAGRGGSQTGRWVCGPWGGAPILVGGTGHPL